MSDFRTVNTPDGPVRFPATMSDDEIKAVLRQKFPPPGVPTDNPWEQSAAAMPQQEDEEFLPETSLEDANAQMGQLMADPGEAIAAQQQATDDAAQAVEDDQYRQQYENASLPVRAATTAFDVGSKIADGGAANVGLNINKAAAKTRSLLLGTSYEEELAMMAEREQARNARMGWLAPAAEIGGGIVGGYGMAKAGLTTMGRVLPKALGGGNALVQGGAKIAGFLGENAALGAANAVARDEDVGLGAAYGAGGAVGGHVAGTLLGRVGSGTRDFLRSFSPKSAAMAKASEALAADMRAGNALSESSFQHGQNAGNPLVNADIGSHAVRGLVKEAVDTGGDDVLNMAKAVGSRAQDQTGRVSTTWNRLTGATDLDDLQVRDGLEDLAANSRKPLYDAAYNSPNANDIWTPELAELTKSDIVRDAMRKAVSKATDWAAEGGFPRVNNPFVEGADGILRMKRGMKPNLPFWDIVQRNIRIAGKANPHDPSYLRLRGKLNRIVDGIVPEFGIARDHAAKIFGGKELYEAGIDLAKKGAAWSDMKRTFSRLTPDEQRLVMAGHAKAEYNKIGGTNPNVDISNWYGDKNFRAKINGMYGPAKAAEFKIQMGWEQAMQSLNNVLPRGSSRTFTDLAKAMAPATGIGAGSFAIGMASGQDWQTALLTAAVVGGARPALRRLSAANQKKVMREVGELLLTNNPKSRAELVERATKSNATREVLDFFASKLAIAARSAAVQQQGDETTVGAPQ